MLLGIKALLRVVAAILLFFAIGSNTHGIPINNCYDTWKELLADKNSLELYTEFIENSAFYPKIENSDLRAEIAKIDSEIKNIYQSLLTKNQYLSYEISLASLSKYVAGKAFSNVFKLDLTNDNDERGRQIDNGSLIIGFILLNAVNRIYSSFFIDMYSKLYQMYINYGDQEDYSHTTITLSAWEYFCSVHMIDSFTEFYREKLPLSSIGYYKEDSIFELN